MARKISDNPELTLEEYASKYASLKVEEKRIKKEVETFNSRIKELMKEQDRTEVDCGNVVVRLTVQNRDTFDEEKLIKQLKHFSPETNCIKTKEYIDMEVLEDEIYRGLLSDDTMCALDACKIHKPVETLTISKVKQ